MDQKLIGTGLVALIIGFAGGYIAAPNKGDLKTQIGSAFAPTSDAINSGVSGLGDQITALNSRLDAMETSLASTADAATDTSGLDALAQRIEAMSGEIGSSLSQTKSDISDSLAKLGDQLSSLPPPHPAPKADASGDSAAAAPAAAPEPELVPADNATPPTGITAGESALFADGAVRAFVSMVGTDTARLSVNGEMATLSTGGTMTVGDCLLTLDAVDRGHAEISGICGAEVPAATGFGPGESAMFDDGKTRVFVSAISEDGSAVRLAVNGLTTQSVTVGESVSVEGDCSVVVEGVDRGHVQLGYACGS
ncbi:hypothetical protein P775_11815 [Puniceibacterium antarcticum]|uniref:Uncharacterized protein n=1 Tax=Puniceibacterium antarcticum TaxID=1206336 RepID=A0A2G8RFY2_9RHOB|nr:hypothetical protein [Puniceibacterium antarcticum]PIL19988.1 hypothetical protein P775_11815 [Puniceibacterium antarcticum]